MKEVLIILPNQLYESNEALQKNTPIYLVEEYMFFNQYNFHKQKLVFQRASMKNYENYLNDNSYNVEYINSNNKLSDIRDLIQFLASSISKINVIDPVDFLLNKRIKSYCDKNNLNLQVYENPSFINKRK
jgi:deoxyribodipyrimidine photolyase-related protein